MHWKKIIGKLMNPAWKRPNVSDMWSITAISDPVEFMGFVFDNVREGEKWYIEIIFSAATREQLNALSKEGRPISLTAENIDTLKRLLPAFDFGNDFVHNRICDDQECLFVAYDNMSHCWLSKRINKQQMDDASKRFKFEYSGKI